MCPVSLTLGFIHPYFHFPAGTSFSPFRTLRCSGIFLGGHMVKTSPMSGQPNPHKLNWDIFNDYDWLCGKDKPDSITPWSERDILCLYEKLLENSLVSLFDNRSSWNTRKEIYSWVINESDKNPFSFNNCCTFTGLEHDVIRDFVILKFKPHLLSQLH